MAVVRPLRALRYGSDLARDLPRLISPPAPGPEDEAGGGPAGVHPLSIVHLTRGRSGPAVDGAGDSPPYAQAARLLQTWKEEGVLCRDPRPGYYLYEQAWSSPDGPVTRRGFVGLVRLEPFGPGASVLPHERTLSRSRADLLAHLAALQTNVSLVFGLVADRSGELAALLREPREVDPLASVRDGEGTLNRLAVSVSAPYVDAVTRAMAGETVVLADGHHRYEAALAYRDLRRAEPGVRRHHPHPFDYVMMLVVPDGDPGLRILPTHRVFRRLPPDRIAALRAGLAEHFDVAALDGLPAVEAFLRLGEPGTRFVLVLPDRLLGAVLRPGAAAAWVEAMPAALREVEVAVLRAVVLRGIMRVGPDDFPPEDHVTYLSDARAALAMVHSGSHQVAFVVRPARPEQVTAVALAGETMPPKSTNFFPKPVKGLLLNPLAAF